MIDDQLLEAWDTHDRMLWILFDAIPPEAFAGKPTGMTGRSVGNIFAHVNNLRLEWIKVSAPDLSDGLVKIPTRTKAEREAITKDQLRPALEHSSQAMRRMFAGGLESGRLRGQRTPLVTLFSYTIAHEWYHVGEIGMTLNEVGFKLDDQTAYAIWSWGRWTPGGKPDGDTDTSDS